MWYPCFNANREKGFLHDERLFTGLCWFPKQVYCCWHPYGRDKDLIGCVQALSHPNRWFLLWVDHVCCRQYVRATMLTLDKQSVCLTLIFQTVITQFWSQCTLKTCSYRDFQYSRTLQRAWEVRRVTVTTIPSPPFLLQLEESSGMSQKFLGRLPRFVNMSTRGGNSAIVPVLEWKAHVWTTESLVLSSERAFCVTAAVAK